MQVIQQHIEINQRLNKIGLFVNDSYFEEEVDLALNKAQDRLIREVLGKGFQDKQLRAEIIKVLLVKNKMLEPFGLVTTDSNYEKNAVYVQIPSDYYSLVNDRSTVLYGNSIGFCENLGTIPVTTQNESISIVPYPVDTGSAPFYVNTVISDMSNSDGTVVLYTAPAPLDTFAYEEQKYLLINDIIETINRGTSGISVYWERYRNTYFKNSFIFVADSSKNRTFGTDKIRFTNGDGDTDVLYSTTAFTVLDEASLKTTLGTDFTQQSVPNRLTESEDLYDALTSVFHGTKKQRPISNQAGDLIYIYFDKSFIVTNVSIDYIRKPRIISLSLNNSCELSEAAQSLLLDYAVEMMKLDIQDPTYKGNVADTELRNQK